MLSVSVLAVLAESGHGPGRNPWWVNVILVVLVIVAIVGWRVRAARRKRTTDAGEIGD